MNVLLTPELESFIESTVSTGRYHSASEVVQEALRLLEERERLRASQIAEFRAEMDDRMAATDRGEVVDGEEAFARLRAKAEARRKRA